MTQTQEQIEHLRTLQETSDFWADVAENQLPALADKIDNIKLPEIDTTELAKQGSNQEATMSAVYEKLQKQLLYDKESGILTITNANLTIN